MHNKKLAAVGVWAAIGHGDSSSCVLSFKRLIVEFVARPPCAVAVWISALDHKAFYDTVENCSIVKIFSGKSDEIIYRYRCIADKKFDRNISLGSSQNSAV